MTTTTVYYNPNCSKCRAALALLRERGTEASVVSYLEQPPTPAELASLLNQLGFADARQLMRKGEAEYAALGLDDPRLTQDALLDALVKHPKLMERPVFVNQRHRAEQSHEATRVIERGVRRTHSCNAESLLLIRPG